MTTNTHRSDWSAAARWVVAIGIVISGMAMQLDATWPGAVLIVGLAMAVFWLLRRQAIQQRQRRMDAAELRSSIRAIGKERER